MTSNVVTPEDLRGSGFAQNFRYGRTLAEKHRSLIDQNPEQPTVKLAFMFKPLRMTRIYAPIISYGFFRTFRPTKNTTCKRPVAALEPGNKDQPLLIETHSFGECRFRAIVERDPISLWPCSETSVYGEERSSEGVRYFGESDKCLRLQLFWFLPALLGTNPEAEHLPGISRISSAVIVIPIKEPLKEFEWQDSRVP